MLWYHFSNTDGFEWAVPLERIAQSYFKYWKGRDERVVSMDQVMDHFLNNPDEAEEWARNNMNWEEVAQFAVRTKTPKNHPDVQEAWANPWETKIDHPYDEEPGEELDEED